MLKWLLISIGAVSVLGGMITVWLPLPLGLPLLMIGTPLLIKYSPHARQLIMSLARHNKHIHKYLIQIQQVNDRKKANN
jgi:hypothetical protein